MNDYAIIKVKGRQYKVSKGDEILVPGSCDEKVEVKLLLRVKEGRVYIGKPFINEASLKFKVVTENIKGKKIDVIKYKAKSRYRKKAGFRSLSTKLLLEKLD